MLDNAAPHAGKVHRPFVEAYGIFAFFAPSRVPQRAGCRSRHSKVQRAERSILMYKLH